MLAKYRLLVYTIKRVTKQSVDMSKGELKDD